MYEFVSGKLVDATVEYAVIQAGGIGYKIFVPLSAFGKMPQAGNEIVLYTSYVVREASQTLYGFLERGERDLFETLINLSGIGPKTALSLVGHLSLTQFHQAIQNNNILMLSKVPGIGKNTAERLIVEMKGKKAELLIEKHPRSAFGTTSLHVQDALNALLNLGFTHATADQAIKKALEELPQDYDLSMLIATALRSNRLT